MFCKNLRQNTSGGWFCFYENDLWLSVSYMARCANIVDSQYLEVTRDLKKVWDIKSYQEFGWKLGNLFNWYFKHFILLKTTEKSKSKFIFSSFQLVKKLPNFKVRNWISTPYVEQKSKISIKSSTSTFKGRVGPSISPWPMGWSPDVVFWGRNTTPMLVRFSAYERARHSLIKNTNFLTCKQKLLSSCF